MSSPSFSKAQFPSSRGMAVRRASIGVVTSLAATILITAVAFVAVVRAKSPQTRKTEPQTGSTQLTVKAATQKPAPANYDRVADNYAASRLAFEPNVGQTDTQVKYMARGRGYSLFLTPNAAYFAMPLPSKDTSQNRATTRASRERAGVLAIRGKRDAVTSLQMNILGSNPNPKITAENQMSGVTNYILGRDKRKWHSGVSHYRQVRYHNIYPGVDLAFHGASHSQDKFEFDFFINPGVKPEAIALSFSGSKSLRAAPSGDLVLASAAGDLHLHRPIAYQEKNSVRQPVYARFVVYADNRVSFALGNYDHSRELVIDPTVTYSTYLGGSLEDDANAIAVDGSGNAYITGQTDSTNFTGAGTLIGGFDVFVTKLSSSGALLSTTLVGGTSDDVGNAIAVDSTGIYVGGSTSSTDFPWLNGPQQTFLTGTNHGFVFKLNTAGSALLWSTFVEGSVGDSVLALAVDAAQEAYIVGDTFSPDLGGGTINPLQGGGLLNNGTVGTSDDGFIAKLSSDGTQYLFLSYLGGSNIDIAEGVAINPSSGNVYVTGLTLSSDFPVKSAFQTQCGTDGSGTCNASGANVFDDAFVTAITSGNTPAYVYSTYLGGENKDDGFAIAVDSAGNAYVTGQTFSTKFPTSNPLTGLTTLLGTQNAFVASLNSAGTALNYSTYLGGSGSEAGEGIAVDSAGNAYVTGYTTSSDFPVTSSTSTFGGGGIFSRDAFVSELNLNGASLSLPFSTYLGGSGDENIVFGAIAVDASGNIYVTGDTNSATFPIANPADGTYNSSGGNCTLLSGGSPIPCPDAFVTVYAPSVSGDFSIAGTALAAVSPGGSSTSTITITPFNNYSNTVSLSCSVSGTSTLGPACSFSPASVAVSGSSSGTSTLTVTTTAATAKVLSPSRRGIIFYASLLPVAGFALLGLASSPVKGWKRLAALLCLFVILSGLVILPACGGGSSSGGGGGGGGSAGTPAGTYTITVTGTDGTITHSIAPPLTLTVN